MPRRRTGGGGGGGSSSGGGSSNSRSSSGGTRQPGGGSSSSTTTTTVERRVDPSDGNAYTRAEFVTEYGGTAQWDAAAPLAALPTAAPPPEEHVTQVMEFTNVGEELALMALSEAADLEAAILLAQYIAVVVPRAPAPAPAPATSSSVAGYAFATDASGLQQAETYGVMRCQSLPGTMRSLGQLDRRTRVFVLVRSAAPDAPYVAHGAFALTAPVMHKCTGAGGTWLPFAAPVLPCCRNAASPCEAELRVRPATADGQVHQLKTMAREEFTRMMNDKGVLSAATVQELLLANPATVALAFDDSAAAAAPPPFDAVYGSARRRRHRPPRRWWRRCREA